MSDQGWIKLHRAIRDNWVWENGNERYAKWWIDILLMVNHKPKKVPVNGKLITIETGERLTSLRKLASKWDTTPRTVSNFLEMLESDDMIAVTKSRTSGTTLKVNNYADYQGISQQSGTRLTTQTTTHEATHSATQTTYKQEPKNDKKNTPSTSTLEDDFNKLWALYPRKEGKKPAYAAYKRAVTRTKNPATNKQIQDGIVAYKQQLSIDGTDKKFIKQGSTFFNQESWNDYTLMAEEYEKQRPKFDKDEWLMMAYRTNGSVDKVLELIDIDQPPIEKDYAVQFLESVGGGTY